MPQPPLSGLAIQTNMDHVMARLALLDQSVMALYENVPFGCHSTAEDGTYSDINALELAWLGYGRDELIGKRKPADFLSSGSQKKYQNALELYGAHGFADLELMLVGKSGVERPISLSFNGYLGATGQPRRNRTAAFDLTSSKHHLEKQRIAAIAFESLAGICVTDAKGIILQVNQAFTTLTGYSPAEAVGQTMHMLSSGHHDKAFYHAMWHLLHTQSKWQGEIYNRRKDGEIIAEWLSISAISAADGTVTNFVGTFYDITANKAAQEQISHMAYFDVLTQLPNRRLLLDRIGKMLSAMQRTRFHGALLFIDLDNFKAINDSRGHDAGDLLLIEAAQRLMAAVREGDSVARMGGDEFVVLLDQLDSDAEGAAHQAEYIGQKLLLVLAQPYMLGDFEFRCSASIGITLFAGSDTSMDLLQQADLAMYQAKKRGKNTLQFFDPNMQSTVSARLVLEQDLHRALRQGELQLYFQPQVNTQGRITSAEGLLR